MNVPQQSTQPHPTRFHRAGRGFRVLAASALLLFAFAVLVLRVSGGHWFMVRTPSMGTAAPVGSLVVTSPVSVASLRVGDVISFHPPTERSETFTHRIVEISQGSVRTKGDINGARDPWVLTSGDIIGRARLILPGVGWLVRALPLLSIVIATVWLITARMRSDLRGPLRLFGVVGALSLAVVLLHPLLGVVQMQTVTGTGNGTGSVAFVSTGLLPVRVESADGSANVVPVDLTAGEVGVVHITADHGQQFKLRPRLHLTGWSLAAAAVVAGAPTLWSLLIGFWPPPDGPVLMSRHSRRRRPADSVHLPKSVVLAIHDRQVLKNT